MVSKRWTPRNHAMGGLFVFLLLALFALTCLVTVLLSVQGYLGIQADAGAFLDALEKELSGT